MIKVMYNVLLLISLTLHINTGLAEEKVDILNLLKARMEQARGPARELKIDIKITDERLKETEPHKLLALLAPYEKDPEWSVRHTAHFYIVRVANIHPITQIRQEVARRLVEAEINGTDRGAIKFLMDFTAKDFNDQSKALIRQALTQANKDKIGGDPSVWLCGVANMKDQLPVLKEFLIDEVAYSNDPNMKHFPEWYYTTGWAARLARARIGIKEDIARCIELAEAEQDSTERVLRILPQIGYIRQPEAIKYLQKYLESKKRLPPINPIHPGELHASRVMHILAKSLRNYPVKRKKARNYTQEEIDLCRKWMSEQTKWVIIR